MPIDTDTASGRAAKFETVGDRIEGRIISADAKPQTDIDTGEVKVWNDGNPIIQWVIVVQTSEPAIDDNDDGVRTLYAKGGNFTAATGTGQSMMNAIRDAVKSAGAKQVVEGGTLTVAHTGLGEKKKAAYSAPKLYKAKYVPPTAGIAVDDLI